MTRAKELIAAFDEFIGKYRRDEMEEALTLQAEITPLLIAVLEDIASNPIRYSSEEHHAEAYAVALLAHFREKKAHIPIIRAFSIPDEQRDYIWSDMLTETLPAILCRTAGGDYSAIMEIIRNREAYEYLRAAAMEALKLGIASGDLPREEGIALFATLFDETLAEPEDYFWASLVMDLLDIYPGELITEIRDLYAKGFVFEGEVSLKEVEEVMSLGSEAAMKTFNDKLQWRMSDDVHQYISWFACFRENDTSTPRHAASPIKGQMKNKDKSRNKRKLAKASKRKNRR